MSSDDEYNFGFTDEPAGREKDPFADLSEEEFNEVYDLAHQVAEIKDETDSRRQLVAARDAWLEAKRIYKINNVMGARKYGRDDYRRNVAIALIKGEKPCKHGQFESLVHCGSCELQKRTNRVVQNPVCTHTRIDADPFGDCPACASEADIEEIEPLPLHPSAMRRTPLRHRSPSRPEGHEFTLTGHPQNSEAELGALIALLLNRFGGSVTLTDEEVQQLSELARNASHSITIKQDVKTSAVVISHTGPITSAWQPAPPRKWAASNPRPTPPSPSWAPLASAEEDEDLPF